MKIKESSPGSVGDGVEPMHVCEEHLDSDAAHLPELSRTEVRLETVGSLVVWRRGGTPRRGSSQPLSDL